MKPIAFTEKADAIGKNAFDLVTEYFKNAINTLANDYENILNISIRDLLIRAIKKTDSKADVNMFQQGRRLERKFG